MTAQDDQNFYEKKERLLHRVQAGTATQAQKEWLIHWEFLEKPKLPLKPMHDSPTRTNKVYRYRGPMSATPSAKLEGSPQAEPRPKKPTSRKNRSKSRSVRVKYQTMQ